MDLSWIMLIAKCLLEKDKSVTIHHKNIQVLMTEMYKVSKGLGPEFMEDIFTLSSNKKSDNISAKIRSNSQFYNYSNPRKVYTGLETLRSLGPKLWEKLLLGIREAPSLDSFKLKIKTWTPKSCPCRLCLTYIQGVGFL